LKNKFIFQKLTFIIKEKRTILENLAPNLVFWVEQRI